MNGPRRQSHVSCSTASLRIRLPLNRSEPASEAAPRSTEVANLVEASSDKSHERGGSSRYDDESRFSSRAIASSRAHILKLRRESKRMGQQLNAWRQQREHSE